MSRNLILAIVATIVATGGLFWAAGRFSRVPDLMIGAVVAEIGFTAIRPASKHVPPGTLVFASQTAPISLSVICGAEASLGLNFDSLRSSPTFNTEYSSALDRNLTLNTQLLSKLKGNGALEDIRNVTLKLSNVRVLEISDAIVIDHLRNRSEACREAIRLRLQGDEVVTMVRSALVADVTFVAALTTEGHATVSADVQDKLATSLTSKVTSADNGKVTLVGQNLIWGIRDDKVLASYGTLLPSVGGSKTERRALSSEVSVEEIKIDEQARYVIPDEFRVVRHDVRPLRQMGTMDCWVTVFTMIASWRDNTNYRVAEVIAALGSEYLTYWRENSGLPGGKERKFAEHTGMMIEPPKNYTLTFYIKLLQEYGPLWIITGDGISAHAKLLVGIFGPTFDESLSSYQSTQFEFIDPATGLFTYLSALEFTAEFEREVGALGGLFKYDDLRWQILHLGP